MMAYNQLSLRQPYLVFEMILQQLNLRLTVYFLILLIKKNQSTQFAEKSSKIHYTKDFYTVIKVMYP